tara:strand:- start:315 stop:581 length:267 start_codon:yes stop_codon:yes gene_type:complete
MNKINDNYIASLEKQSAQLTEKIKEAETIAEINSALAERDRTRLSEAEEAAAIAERRVFEEEAARKRAEARVREMQERIDALERRTRG